MFKKEDSQISMPCKKKNDGKDFICVESQVIWKCYVGILLSIP